MENLDLRTLRSGVVQEIGHVNDLQQARHLLHATVALTHEGERQMILQRYPADFIVGQRQQHLPGKRFAVRLS